MRRESLPIGLACACALMPMAAQAQVEASLVARDTSIQPGHPFTIALRLQHAPHWHSYWINPGIGYPSSLSWHLPAGFIAGDIQWPTPQVLKNAAGEVTGNGYLGDTLLMVTVTPPATLKVGKPVSLAATAKWLMCEYECIPREAELTLASPVSTAAPKGNPEWADKFARAAAELPRALPGWSVHAARQGAVVTLSLEPAHSISPTTGALHFFSDDNTVGYELPQEVKRTVDGGIRLTLHISAPGASKVPGRLVGVLLNEGGWQADGSVHGLRVDVPWQ